LKSKKKDVTSSMIKWVECRGRAFLFKQSGPTLVFDAVIKSDTLISSELHHTFKELVNQLESKMDEGGSFKS
jgi:hypothetical protein